MMRLLTFVNLFHKTLNTMDKKIKCTKCDISLDKLPFMQTYTGCFCYSCYKSIRGLYFVKWNCHIKLVAYCDIFPFTEIQVTNIMLVKAAIARFMETELEKPLGSIESSEINIISISKL